MNRAAPPPATPPPQDAPLGVAQGVGAYLLWGVMPFYFHALSHVRPLEVLAHRVVWTVALLGGWLLATGGLGQLGAMRRSPGVLTRLLLTSALITMNWLVFIVAIGRGQLNQASLGYFLNPLLTVALGSAVLKERLMPWQKVSFGLAFLGVVWQTVALGDLPLVALFLAVTFAFYSLLRKMTPQALPIPALLVETSLALPLALGALWWLHAQTPLAVLAGGHDTFLLLLAGLVTAGPLLLFTAATRHARLSTMGFLQYIAPSLQFVIAVFAFGEAMPPSRLWGFVLVWLGLLVYVADSLARAGRRR